MNIKYMYREQRNKEYLLCIPCYFCMTSSLLFHNKSLNCKYLAAIPPVALVSRANLLAILLTTS